MSFRRTVCAILIGGLVVGALDALDALIFFGLRGAQPARIFQTIAGGLIGAAASYRGGAWTVLLGILCHFTVATCIVATYSLASLKMPSLARRPFVYGPIFGVVAYGVMTFVVVPASAL